MEMREFVGRWYEQYLALLLGGICAARSGVIDKHGVDVLIPPENVPEALRELFPRLPRHLVSLFRREVPRVTEAWLCVQAKRNVQDGLEFQRESNDRAEGHTGWWSPPVVTGALGRVTRETVLWAVAQDGFCVGREVDNRHEIERQFVELTERRA